MKYVSKKVCNCNKFNGEIEVIRYLFAFLVALLHFWDGLFGNGWLLEAGYLAVDLFFVLSGLFLSISLDKRPQNPFTYTFNKWKGMSWIYVSSIIVSLLLRETGSIVDVVKRFFVAIPDITGLQMTGFVYPTSNGILWYVSVMLYVGFFLCTCVQKFKEYFVNFIAPLFIVLGYAYIFAQNGNLDATSEVGDGFIPFGVIRGFSGMSLGVLLRIGSDRIKESGYVLRKQAKYVLSAVQILGFGIVVICFMYPHTKYDFYMIFGIIAIILPAYLQSTLWSVPINNMGNYLINIFGKQYTLAIYAYSTVVYTLLGCFVDLSALGRVKAVVLYLPCLILVGFVISRFTEWISKCLKNRTRKEVTYDTEICI